MEWHFEDPRLPMILMPFHLVEMAAADEEVMYHGRPGILALLIKRSRRCDL
ncbi:hypothetical protein JOW62_05940 [Escherichia coli]|uniref:hypothetical protein n=1 Tax=Escherichia coli TaxID=562 RepID=UPI0012FF6B97|nr:hypothetical protein [Escherichia coli]EFA4243582.1 hypothetical protein [Escherichia coli O36:H5]EFA8564575.1 hypothetical protein [Escherichia coli O157]EHS0497730.1 hypothetical protein [Escherichia coli O26]EES0913487.1 hypothetical protein [Escherichia coli]EEZ3920638.1 hypothetical protein [Escherichia coli]